MEDVNKLKTISHLLSKNMSDMSGVPHPCQYIDLCRNDPTQICDESTQWLKDMKIPIWSRLYPSNCVGHSRELSCTKVWNYNIEIPHRLYSLWGSADTHSLVAEKMWRLERYQWVCNVLICCVALKYNPNEWSCNLLDDIVYRGSLIFAELCQKHKIINREFRINHMSTLMQFRNTYYKVMIEEKAKGFLYIPYGFNEFNLARALTYFFRFYQFGILECRQRCLAFGFATDVDQGYFMYDCQCIGLPFLDDNQANACVLRTNHLQVLLYCLIVALNVNLNNVRFKIYNVDILIEDPTERRPKKHVYVPTITRPVKVNGKDKSEQQHKNLGKANVDERFKVYNYKKDRGMYNFMENNSSIENGVKIAASLGETKQSNQTLAERAAKELHKMEHQIQDQGDFEVSLPATKSASKQSLLAEIESKEPGLEERTAASNEKISSILQIPDVPKDQVSPNLFKGTNSCIAKSTPTAPIKFVYRKPPPKDIKQIFDKSNCSTTDNQKNGLDTNYDIAYVQNTYISPLNLTNSCYTESKTTIKPQNPVDTNRGQQPQIDFRMPRKSFQTRAELIFNRRLPKSSEPNSFLEKRKQNTTKLWTKNNNEIQKPVLKITESRETLKPPNSCTKTDLEIKEPLKQESSASANLNKIPTNNQKQFTKNDTSWNNPNDRMPIGPKLKTFKEKSSSPTGSTNTSHLTGRKLSSTYESKNQILPQQTCNLKAISDPDLIELYDVVKPSVLDLKVYLVNNRPQNVAYNETETIPKKIRIVKTMF